VDAPKAYPVPVDSDGDAYCALTHRGC
jgi:hypothetical protein